MCNILEPFQSTEVTRKFVLDKTEAAHRLQTKVAPIWCFLIISGFFSFITVWTAKITWNLVVVFFAMRPQSEQSQQNSCDFYFPLHQHSSQFWTGGSHSEYKHGIINEIRLSEAILCHDSTSLGSDSTPTQRLRTEIAAIAPQKNIITILSLSPHSSPPYHLQTNSLVSTAHQLVNETVNADFWPSCLVLYHSMLCVMSLLLGCNSVMFIWGSYGSPPMVRRACAPRTCCKI